MNEALKDAGCLSACKDKVSDTLSGECLVTSKDSSREARNVGRHVNEPKKKKARKKKKFLFTAVKSKSNKKTVDGNVTIRNVSRKRVTRSTKNDIAKLQNIKPCFVNIGKRIDEPGQNWQKSATKVVYIKNKDAFSDENSLNIANVTAKPNSNEESEFSKNDASILAILDELAGDLKDSDSIQEDAIMLNTSEADKILAQFDLQNL